jgi:mRNA interferase MazF
LKTPIEHGRLYLADLSPRRGTEPGVARPVLVVQSDLLNSADHPSTWILPCTTRTTRLTGENLLRVQLPRGIAGNAAACEVMIDQSRSIDNRRFRRRLGRLPRVILNEVKLKLKLLAEI